MRKCDIRNSEIHRSSERALHFACNLSTCGYSDGDLSCLRPRCYVVRTFIVEKGNTIVVKQGQQETKIG